MSNNINISRKKLISVTLLVLTVAVLYRGGNQLAEATTTTSTTASSTSTQSIPPYTISLPAKPASYAIGDNSTSSKNALSPYYTVPASFTFRKNLSLGMDIDPDIAYLQRVLNSNINTLVSDTGAGSDTTLTTSFGTKTYDAVLRFQQLYKDDILAKAGLKFATGFVGQFTRAKLNEILSKGLPTKTYTSNASVGDTSSAKLIYVPINGNASINYGTRQITDLSVYNAVPGETMSLYGQGFHPSLNKLYLGPIYAGTYSSQNTGTKVNFRVPAIIPSGRYQLQINNEFGTTTSGLIFLNVNASSTSTNSSKFNIIMSKGTSTNPLVKFFTNPNVSDATLRTMLEGGDISHASGAEILANVSGKAGGIGASSFFASSTKNATDGTTKTLLSTTAGTNIGSKTANTTGSVLGVSVISALIDYFGGPILTTTVCTCDGTTLLTIMDYATFLPVTTLYIPLISTLNANFNIWVPSTYVIGGTYPLTSTCLVNVGTPATPVCVVAGVAESVIDTFRGIGTAAY